jgi:hypothetical protein
MAYELSAGGANVKIRRAWAPIGLGIITLGIYDVVWYYKINREMRHFGAVSNDRALAATNPVASVLAVTLGALIVVPAIVSYLSRRGVSSAILGSLPGRGAVGAFGPAALRAGTQPYFGPRSRVGSGRRQDV